MHRQRFTTEERIDWLKRFDSMFISVG